MKTIVKKMTPEIKEQFKRQQELRNIREILEKEEELKKQKREEQLQQIKNSKKPVVIIPDDMKSGEYKRLRKKSTQVKKVGKNIKKIERPAPKLVRTTSTAILDICIELIEKKATKEKIISTFTDYYRRTKGVGGKFFIEKKMKHLLPLARKMIKQRKEMKRKIMSN